MSEESLEVQNNFKVELNEFRAVEYVVELVEKWGFVFVLSLLDVGREVGFETLDLVPDSIKLLKIVLEYLILTRLDREFFPGNDYLINFKVLFAPDQHLIHNPLHNILENLDNNSMQPFQSFQLDNIRLVGLYNCCDCLQDIFYDIKEHVRLLVKVTANNRYGEELLFVLGEFFLDHRDVKLSDLWQGLGWMDWGTL